MDLGAGIDCRPQCGAAYRLGPYCGEMEIKPGDHVEVVNARGERHERVAVTGVVQGRDFPVVRVASVEEFLAAATEQRAPESFAWPMEDVSPLQVTQ